VKIKPRLLQSATISFIDFAGIFFILVLYYICQICYIVFYNLQIYSLSLAIASIGQTAAQVPHPMHLVLSIWHLPFGASIIAIAGHAPMQE
jgi:hypothetical protein